MATWPGTPDVRGAGRRGDLSRAAGRGPCRSGLWASWPGAERASVPLGSGLGDLPRTLGTLIPPGFRPRNYRTGTSAWAVPRLLGPAVVEATRPRDNPSASAGHSARRHRRPRGHAARTSWRGENGRTAPRPALGAPGPARGAHSLPHIGMSLLSAFITMDDMVMVTGMASK